MAARINSGYGLGLQGRYLVNWNYGQLSAMYIQWDSVDDLQVI